MSAASRARARALEQKLLEERYGPFPPFDQTPPTLEEQDPELAERIKWFIQNRKEINDVFDAKRIFISDSEKRYVEMKPIKHVVSEAEIILVQMLALTGASNLIK